MLETYRKVGLREAERRSGVHRETIVRWAREAGVDTQEVTRQVSEKQRRAAMAAGARTARELAETQERLVSRLAKVSEASLIRTLEVLAAGGFGPGDLQALTQAHYRAIQQLELLSGRATSRHESLDTRELTELIVPVIRAGLGLVADEELREAVSAAISDGFRQLVEQRDALELEAGEDADFAPLDENGGAEPAAESA